MSGESVNQEILQAGPRGDVRYRVCQSVRFYIVYVGFHGRKGSISVNNSAERVVYNYNNGDKKVQYFGSMKYLYEPILLKEIFELFYSKKWEIYIEHQKIDSAIDKIKYYNFIIDSDDMSVEILNRRLKSWRRSKIKK